jgi:hypothetical protein
MNFWVPYNAGNFLTEELALQEGLCSRRLVGWVGLGWVGLVWFGLVWFG